MRGNPQIDRIAKSEGRSIPACAGEPVHGHAPGIEGAVYPRVCGGTLARRCSLRFRDGLSPRVRGNQLHPGRASISRGSIPACAGEPTEHSPEYEANAVYPRVCGGTNSKKGTKSVAEGLSPRVRGNLSETNMRDVWNRSIPACAGEPKFARAIGNKYGVYPRVCGGTASCTSWGAASSGLSPRVRGNHSVGAMAKSAKGSIPACAGEPLYALTARSARKVYPRVCGGTGRAGGGMGYAYGLSPRVRGNRVHPVLS